MCKGTGPQPIPPRTIPSPLMLPLPPLHHNMPTEWGRGVGVGVAVAVEAAGPAAGAGNKLPFNHNTTTTINAIRITRPMESDHPIQRTLDFFLRFRSSQVSLQKGSMLGQIRYGRGSLDDHMDKS